MNIYQSQIEVTLYLEFIKNKHLVADCSLACYRSLWIQMRVLKPEHRTFFIVIYE